MRMVSFQRKDCFCPEYTVWDLHRWLVSASLGTEIIYYEDYNARSFFETLENKEGLIALRDISWVNKICRSEYALGRDYKQPTFKPPTNTVSGSVATAKKTMNTPEEEKALNQISAAYDRASVRR